MASDNKLQQIIWLIADQTGCKAERITQESRLQTDLGVAGEDGYDLLVRFEEEFAIDMTPLRYDEHFEAEGISLGAGLWIFGFVLLILFTPFLWPWIIPIWAIAIFLFLRFRPHVERLKEIRVSDLVRSAEAQRWTYDYPDSPSFDRLSSSAPVRK